jgi:hypothetical protein
LRVRGAARPERLAYCRLPLAALATMAPALLRLPRRSTRAATADYAPGVGGTASTEPFVATADRLGDRLDALSTQAQVLFYCCVARALLREPDELAAKALAAAERFAVNGAASDAMPSLLKRIENRAASSATPAVTQNGWICSDIALRVAMNTYPARDGVWYALEPQFHATCERLFGFIDVGSDREQRDERIALCDPTLVDAVAALESLLDHLGASDEVSERVLRFDNERLQALRP